MQIPSWTQISGFLAGLVDQIGPETVAIVALFAFFAGWLARDAPIIAVLWRFGRALKFLERRAGRRLKFPEDFDEWVCFKKKTKSQSSSSKPRK